MIAITEHLARLEIGSGQTYDGLTIFPVTSEISTLKVPDYLTLDQALEQKTARIEEISQSGTVPELMFFNQAVRPVLVLGGEELVGAKQNRVLNATILVPPKSSLKVPVSCVEQGRWAYRSETFSSSGNIHYGSGRARLIRSVSASRSRTGSYQSIQSEVWSHISRTSVSLGSISRTSAMSDIFTNMGPRIEAYTRTFSPSPDQTGLIAYIPGKVMGFDLFDHHETLSRLFGKLIRSYAIDILAVPPEAQPPDRSLAVDFLKALVACEIKSSPSIGEGDDIRLEDASRTAAGLAARCRIVHLSGFQLLESDPGSSDSAGPGNDAAAEGIPLPPEFRRIMALTLFYNRPAPEKLAGILAHILESPPMKQIAPQVIIEVPGEMVVENPGQVRWNLYLRLMKATEKARTPAPPRTTPEPPEASPTRVTVSTFLRDDRVVVRIDDGGGVPVDIELTAGRMD